MQFKLVVSLAVFSINFVSAQDASPSDAFIDLQGIRNSFETRSDILNRLVNLLSEGWATTEAPVTETKQDVPQILSPFRRLKIFGLQLPPAEQLKNPDGSCSPCPQEDGPDILSITSRPEEANTPSFFVVPPPGTLRSERLMAVQPTHHYQKLEFDDLKREAAEHSISPQHSVVKVW